MNTIFNLMRNELYKLIAMKKRLLFVLPITIGMPFLLPNSLPICYMITVFTVVICNISYDDYYGSLYLYRSLPLSTKTIVLAKYLFNFLLLVVTMLVLWIATILSPNQETALYMSPIAITSFFTGVIYTCATLTLSFYFSMNTVRIVNITLYIIGFGLLSQLVNIFTEIPTLYLWISTNSWLLIIIPILLMMITYQIGLTLYNRKELLY